jgi:hypothetical protein
MNWWTAAIYGVAAVTALQGLLSLMTVHRKAALRRFFDEEWQRRELEAIQQAAKQPEPQATNPGQKTRAA